MVLCARKIPYALHPVSEISPTSLECLSDWWWPIPVLSEKIVKRFLIWCLSPLGDWWCDVFGFVPAGSISSSSTRHIFRDANHLWRLICPPVSLLGHSPWLRRVQGSTSTWVFEGGCRRLTHASLGFPFHFSLFVASALNLWGRLECVIWLSPLGAIQRRAWATASTSIVELEVKTIIIDCTVFMDGSRALLDSETPPWPVFGDSHLCTLLDIVVCWFLEWGAWSLILFYLLAILERVSPSFLVGVSHRDPGIGLGSFPIPWFARALSGGILASLSPVLI